MFFDLCCSIKENKDNRFWPGCTSHVMYRSQLFLGHTTHTPWSTHTREVKCEMRRTGSFSSKSDVCKKRAVQVVSVLICNRVACDFLPVLRCSTPPLPQPASLYVWAARELPFFGIKNVVWIWNWMNLKRWLKLVALLPETSRYLAHFISFGYLRGAGELWASSRITSLSS